MQPKSLLLMSVFFTSLAFASDTTNLPSSLADEEVQEQIQTIISMRHPTDTRDTWRNLSNRNSHVVAIMKKMIQNKPSIYQKIRLMDALGWFEGEAVGEFLKQSYQAETNPSLKGAALRAVARSRGAKERKFIQTELGSAPPAQKVRVCKILDGAGSPEATQMVDDLLAKESNMKVIRDVKAARAANSSR